MAGTKVVSVEKGRTGFDDKLGVGSKRVAELASAVGMMKLP